MKDTEFKNLIDIINISESKLKISFKENSDLEKLTKLLKNHNILFNKVEKKIIIHKGKKNKIEQNNYIGIQLGWVF